MKYRWLIAYLGCVALLLAMPSTVDARSKPKRSKKGEFEANKGFGLGLMLGVPSGLAGKYYLSENGSTALDFGVGNYYRRSRGGLSFHVDFLWHPFVLGKSKSLWVPFYVGVGARVLDHGEDDRDRDHLHIGARAPIGIALDFNNIPIDIFLELALVVDIVRDDHAFSDFNLALGLRYYFN